MLDWFAPAITLKELRNYIYALVACGHYFVQYRFIQGFGKLVLVVFLCFLCFLLVLCFELNNNTCTIIIYISVTFIKT